MGVCEYFNHDSFPPILNAACFSCRSRLGLYLPHDGHVTCSAKQHSSPLQRENKFPEELAGVLLG